MTTIQPSPSLPLALLLFLTLLSSLPLPSHSYSLLPTLSQPPIPILSPRSPTTGLTRFAYVAMHYEGTPRDDEYLLGLRVLIHSLLTSGTSQDVVVLLSSNARPSTAAQLLSLGVRLHTVDNLHNPFKDTTSLTRARSYKPRFEFTFNKLYLWNLTQYERVVYLDSDNVVLSNPDELFLCGHFCVVFMNPLLFHTGLMVIRPHTDTFTALTSTLFSSSSYSHDGADQGFLCAVFEMEAAPLFDSRRSVPGVPSEEPRQRLAIGYNLNQFWYYTYFSWDFFRRNTYYYNQYPVPGLSIAYPSNWWMKPWYWYSEAYLYHHWTWQIVRYQLDGYGQGVPTVLTRLLLALGVVAATVYAIPSVAALPLCDLPARVVRGVVGLAPAYAGWVVGLSAFGSVSYTAFRWIPMTTPTIIAYPLYVLLHVSMLWAVYCAFCHLLRGRGVGGGGGGGGGKEGGVWEGLVGWRSLAVFVLMHLFTFHLFHPYWPHFIIKIATMIWTAMLWAGVDAYMFVRAAQRLCHSKAA